MKKKHMTMDEHRVLGEKLHVIRNTLSSVSVVLANRYLVNGKEYRLADRARITVDELRCHLDNIVHGDCPSGTGFQEINRLYYPGEGAPAAVTLKPELETRCGFCVGMATRNGPLPRPTPRPRRRPRLASPPLWPLTLGGSREAARPRYLANWPSTSLRRPPTSPLRVAPRAF